MSSTDTDRKCYEKFPRNNVHMGHLRVTSYQLRIEKLKEGIEIQKCDFKYTSYKFYSEQGFVTQVLITCSKVAIVVLPNFPIFHWRCQVKVIKIKYPTNFKPGNKQGKIELKILSYHLHCNLSKNRRLPVFFKNYLFTSKLRNTQARPKKQGDIFLD